MTSIHMANNTPFCRCRTCPLNDVWVEASCLIAYLPRNNPDGTLTKVPYNRHEFVVKDPNIGVRSIYYCDTHYSCILSGDFTAL